MNASMAFCKKQQRRKAAVREHMLNGTEQGCSRRPDGGFHCSGQSFGISQGVGIAVGITGDEVMPNELVLLRIENFSL